MASFKVQMGKVLLLAQRIQHKDLHPFQLPQFGGCYRFGIGDVGEGSDPKAQHRHVVVHHFDRDHGHSQHVEWQVIQSMQIELGNARITLRAECIVVHPTHRFQGRGVAMDIHGSALCEIEGPQFIDACNVIHVFMGEQDGIQLLHPTSQGLLSEVRTGIDQQLLSIHLNAYR